MSSIFHFLWSILDFNLIKDTKLSTWPVFHRFEFSCIKVPDVHIRKITKEENMKNTIKTQYFVNQNKEQHTAFSKLVITV